MLVQLTDYQGAPHWVTWTGQDQINDFSGTLGAGAVGPSGAPQEVAPANTGTTGGPPGRAGWLFQNVSQNPMLLFEIGTSVAPWTVNPGAFFPPLGYPIPTGAIYVQGSGTSVEGDAFTYREWVNAVDE